MKYLLQKTMSAADDPARDIQRDSIIQELICFRHQCRQQVFDAADKDKAAFVIQRYQYDLEFLIAHLAVKNHMIIVEVQAVLAWLYNTYSAYLDLNRYAPEFFIQQQRKLYLAHIQNMQMFHHASVEEQVDETKTITSPITLGDLFGLRIPAFRSALQTDVKEKNKLKVSLTVAQMGVLSHLLFEQKIFIACSRIDIIRSIAENFSTGRQTHISYESLYGKYFKMEPSALSAVKDLLIEMVNRINKWQKET